MGQDCQPFTYAEFIDKVGQDKRFMKCLVLNNGVFDYEKGLNQHFIEISSGNCRGGFSFTTSENIHRMINYGQTIAIIELCEDAIFYFENSYIFKTNKFIIKEFMDARQSEEVYKLAIQCHYKLIEYIESPSEELCLMAIQENPKAIKYIKNPTDGMHKLAEDITKQRKETHTPMVEKKMAASSDEN